MLRCTRSARHVVWTTLAVILWPFFSTAQDQHSGNTTGKPREVSIRVVADDTGLPVAGVAVELRRGEEKWPTTTNAQGLARVSVPAEGEYALHASGESLQKSLTFHWLSSSSLEIPIRLRKGGEVRGTLTDSQGRPVSGVDVRATTVAVPTVQCDSVKSDEQGRYVLRGVPVDQPVNVRVSKYPDYERILETDFALNGAPYRPLDFRLAARRTGGDVEVQVVDREGRPIAEVRIANHGGNSADVLSAVTNEDGRCALKSLHLQYGGRCELVAQAEGFCPQIVRVLPATDRGTPLRITLEPGHRLQGRVMTRDRTPVSGAVVEYGDHNFEFGRIGGQLRTDTEGRFFSKSLPAKVPLRVRADGFDEWSESEIAADGEPIEIVLQPIGMISGTVINSVTRKPVPRFNVKLRYAQKQASGNKGWTPVPESWNYAGRECSSVTGRFTWPGLHSTMDYDLLISADGYEPGRMTGSRSGRDEVIALKPADPERFVAVGGRILDQAGQPIEGVFVHLISFDPERFPQGMGWTEFPLDDIQDCTAAREFACRFDQVRVTSPDGRFEFEKALISKPTELVYWGENTAPERIKRLQLMEPLRLSAFELVAPVTATISGSIDTKEFPDPSGVEANVLRGPNAPTFHGKIRRVDGKLTYSIGGLPQTELAVRLSKQTVIREDGTPYIGKYLDVVVDTTNQRAIKFDFDQAAWSKAFR